MKIFFRVMILIISSTAVFSYANCPSPATFEVTENLTFTARTHQGTWQQVNNHQSYLHQANYNTAAISLFFVIAYSGIHEQFYNNLKIHADKIICIYNVDNQPSQFIILKSPENSHYEVNLSTQESTLNGWRNVAEQTSYCFTKTFPSQASINNYSYCSFSTLN